MGVEGLGGGRDKEGKRWRGNGVEEIVDGRGWMDSGEEYMRGRNKLEEKKEERE